ncbi:MAG: glycosyltransferase family 39 protein [Acidobacteriota bacterium]|nr:MAG: glycosyltransferase family 39 protein [Acidobacteriota bacterium]
MQKTETQAPPATAGISREEFPEPLFFARNRGFVIVFLMLTLAAGFAFRTYQLGSESLGEDEMNKLETVREYRENGLSGKNGEHPFLMKGLQTLSVSAGESINSSLGTNIREEAALRFPIALFGTFTSLLLFLLLTELFGRSYGLIAAAMWAVEPMAIGFDRVAKEDSLVLFFFLLTCLLWVKSQTAAEHDNPRWPLKAWAAGIAFAALMASKYYPHLLAVPAAYYNAFKHVAANKWHMRGKRWLMFLVVMGLAFLLFNPTIMLPETWQEMAKFSGEKRIGHDSYEFMGSLYRNQMSAWLSGVPWTFYYVFIAVKTTLPVLVLFLAGLPLMFRKKMGDGRYLLAIWAFMWFFPFTFLGGKFTRYFTLAEPLILICAATAFIAGVSLVAAKLPLNGTKRIAFETATVALLLAIPIANSLAYAPNYRMFTNVIGGGHAAAGTYFPHDEFYDAATREAVDIIAAKAGRDATIACETPALFDYYAEKHGRSDLRFISLSDPLAVSEMRNGDVVLLTSGRRYFSNTRYEEFLENSGMTPPEATVSGRTAVRIYFLDEGLANSIRGLAVNRN